MSNLLATLIPSCKTSAMLSVAPPLAVFLARPFAKVLKVEPSLVERLAAISPRSFINVLVKSCSPFRPINACGIAKPAARRAASSWSR